MIKQFKNEKIYLYPFFVSFVLSKQFNCAISNKCNNYKHMF